VAAKKILAVTLLAFYGRRAHLRRLQDRGIDTISKESFGGQIKRILRGKISFQLKKNRAYS